MSKLLITDRLIKLNLDSFKLIWSNYTFIATIHHAAQFIIVGEKKNQKPVSCIEGKVNLIFNLLKQEKKLLLDN